MLQGEEENSSDVVRDEELPSNETIDEGFIAGEGSTLVTIKRKIVVKPRRKKKDHHSQTQALAYLSEGMTQMIESQSKRDKAVIEFERERDQKVFEFNRLEAEKNHEHELKIAQLFAFSIQSVHSGGRIYSQSFHQLSYQNPSSPIYPNISTTLFTW